MPRAQLSLSLLEAAVGVVLLLAITMGFALGVPEPDTREPQLEAYAEDAATLLSNEQPRHRGATRLSEVVASPQQFQRERATLRDRIDRLLPANLMFRVETDHGAVGYAVPGEVPTGEATVTTVEGAVRIRVWYA